MEKTTVKFHTDSTEELKKAIKLDRYPEKETIVKKIALSKGIQADEGIGK